MDERTGSQVGLGTTAAAGRSYPHAGGPEGLSHSFLVVKTRGLGSIGAVLAVALTGDDLSIDQFEAVARGAARVELAAEAVERMRAANDAIPRVLARGDSVYGLTTGVGAHKKYRVADAERDEFNRLLLPSHLNSPRSPSSPYLRARSCTRPESRATIR